jgi:hypothetical protein
MQRVLLLLPTTSYRNEAFLAAGKKLGVEIVTAADYCDQLAPEWGLDPIMAVHFDKAGEALEIVLRSLEHKPDAVLAVDDPGSSSPRCSTNAWAFRLIRPRRCGACATSWRSGRCKKSADSCVPIFTICRATPIRPNCLRG